MLILSRKLGETIVVGEEIKIIALGSKGNRQRIGIAAPKDIGIHREEIYLKIKEKNSKGRKQKKGKEKKFLKTESKR
jgi:carbon storage regulator